MTRTLLLWLALAAPAAAQPIDVPAAPPPDTMAARYATSAGVVLSLTEDGLGAGLHGRLGVGRDASLTAEVGAAAARDAREQRFFVGFFGDTVTPFKRSYAVLVPVLVGLERRLFRRAVEDNVRPFVALAAGPTVAVQWPYFDDRDGDGRRASAEPRLGPLAGLGEADVRVGVAVGASVGAYLGRRPRAVQGVRLGLTVQHVPRGVDLLELDPGIERPTRTTFWTPTVSVLLVRIAPDGGAPASRR